MNFKFIQGVLTLFLGMLVSVDGWAANGFTCSIVNPTSITFTIPYAFGGTSNYVGKKIPVTCTRAGNTNNAESVRVDVGISNGGNAAGAQNNAAGAGLINYDFYTTPGNPCSAEVTPTSTTNLFATVAFPSGISTVTADTNTVYACVPPPALNANGAYSDNATAVITLLTPSNSGGALTINPVTATLRVDIAIPQRCDISTPIGALTFNYTSFGAAIQPSTKFKVTCGAGLNSPLPTMALTNATGQPLTSGTAAGLAYTLALNTLANLTGGTPTLSVLPGGSATEYRINGNMVAGQAGSCATADVDSAGSTCIKTISGATGHYITVTW